MKHPLVFLLVFTVLSSCEPAPRKAYLHLSNSGTEKDYSSQIDHLANYALKHKYNQEITLMIDYSLHSGSNRFFVIDLKKKSLLKKGLVCHGNCKGKSAYAKAKEFSNEPDSHCSTLGMAVVAERAYSSWGKNFKYWLDGLEEGNKNMRKRVVVLHAWEGVPDQEIYPKALATSWGCPTVSIAFLDELDTILKKEKKVLLYSFDD